MITQRLGLGPKSLVIELASNDGYLLQNFVQKSIPVLGIDPAANVAEAAVRKGVPTLVRFFGEATARELLAQGKQADLLLGNNVLAHVPALNDFVAGAKLLLKPDGVITMEFPHLQRLIEGNQFDTIYHEHFSYFSFPDRREDVQAAWIDGFRCRGTCPRMAVRCGSMCGMPRTKIKQSPNACIHCETGNRILGFERLETYADFDGQVKRDQAETAGISHRRKARREISCRIRGPRQGQHPAELLRHPNRFSGLYGGSKPLQAWEVSSRNAYPHSCARSNRANETGLCPDSALELERGDHRPTRLYSRMGRAVCGADSGSCGLLR